MLRPPRFGDAPRRGPPPASAEEVARLMRRVGLAAGALTVWALAGVLASVGPSFGLTPSLAVALALVFALVAGISLARAPALAVAGTIALAFAVAGHVLHWRGANLHLLLLTMPPLARGAVFAAALLLVPLYAGARLRALRLAWEASGSRARGARLLAEALAPGAADATTRPAWRRAWAGALAAWAKGLALPGALAAEILRAARRPADRLHAETSLDVLARELPVHGLDVERAPRGLVVRAPDAPPVALATGRILFPPGPALDARGPHDDVLRLRKLLEAGASHAIVFSWSAPARRWERRLNALQREARVAASLEERSLVMEELDRIHRAIHSRALCGEERQILLLKERDARALLSHRMLSEPPGLRGETRVLSQHGALLPDVARVLDAGGLSAVKRVVFVPHWVLPVPTAWGEQEVVVNATTGKLDPDESRDLLAAMSRAGPSLFLDVGAQATFLPAPPPTAALLRETREKGLRIPESVARGEVPPDLVYVPYLATAEGYLSGVTGRAAPDLGNAVPVAAGA